MSLSFSVRWHCLAVLLVLLCDSLWPQSFAGDGSLKETTSVSSALARTATGRGMLASAQPATKDKDDDKKKNKRRTTKKESSPLRRSIFEGMLGETLYAWSADVDSEGKTHPFIYETGTSELLQDKETVGLYFSASWCGPCQKFTPVLESFYNEVRKQRGHDSFEIVWISRDQRAEDFVKYFQKMPWLAVTMENMDRVAQLLGPRYGVQGIPHFVLLDGEDATVYTLDGRGKVVQDPYGLQFPYRSRSPWSLLVPKSLRRLTQLTLFQARERVKSILKALVPKFLWTLLRLQ